MTETSEGLVLRSQSGQYWVRIGDEVVHCRVRGRLKKGRARTDLAVIGDRVRVHRLDESGEGVIEEVSPRDNRFARRQPGGRGRYKEHVLVANLDWLVVVFAFDRPALNPRLLDRFLVIAGFDRIPAAIVVNKLDLVSPEVAEAMTRPYAELGYPVFHTTAKDGVGIEPVRELLRGAIGAFVGPSGVGKSSLLNALSPGLGLAVGAVSETLDKGRHTTRVAELHALESGGFLADTPGIRELASFQLPTEELADCFPEFRPHLGRCRFGSCTHRTEPACAVRAAMTDGSVRRDRYESYLRILADEER